MFALKCKCVGHIWGQWQNVCCHGNGILFQNWKTKHTVTQWITARGGGINHLQWGFFWGGGLVCVCVCVCVCGCECKKKNMWHYTVDNWENCNVTRTISGGSLYWKMVIDNHDHKKVVYIPLIIAKQIMHPSKKGNATRLSSINISFVLDLYSSSQISLKSLFICLLIDALFVRIVSLGRMQGE